MKPVFFHDNLKEPFVAIPIDGHTEIKPIYGKDFEIWLGGLFYKKTGNTISKDSLKQCIGAMVSEAIHENPKPIDISVRVAENEDAFWYDLSNADWQAVKVTKDGWDIVDNPPILFTRYNHQRDQVKPSRQGNIRKVLEYVNLSGNETLFLCWLVSCFVPNIPHAMPVLYGEKGAAKSTSSSIIKSLVDPSALETIALPSDQRSLTVCFSQHWFLPFDNVSFINEDTSDTLCRAITGGGIIQRKLHSNFDDAILTFQRCILLNGVNNVATRSDLLDRAILMEIARITEDNRKELSKVLQAFEAEKPIILGGIFDILSKAMSIYPNVKLKTLPRMADFAKWGYAIGEVLGEGLGEVFINEYTSNRRQQNDEVINNDPTLTLVVEFMRDRSEWSGTHSDLYKRLVEIADNFTINTRDKYFPKDATRLSAKLRANKSNLENTGISYVPPTATNRKNNSRNLSLKNLNVTSTTEVSNTTISSDCWTTVKQQELPLDW